MMNIAIWVTIAVVCFVLPATALTSGGRRSPSREGLGRRAAAAGLPLTDEVAGPVGERIRRRQRGMSIGGLSAIVVATIAAVFLFEDDSGSAALIVMVASVGTAFGGAWAIAVHRPSETSETPVVARLRSVRLSDYLTTGERRGYWAAPGLTVVGALGGLLLLLQLPAEARGSRILLGLIGTALVLLTWGVATLSLRRVLAAPARSGSELELAWDDAERADGLRQVVNLTVTAGFLSFLFWMLLIAESLMGDGFYRQHLSLSFALTAAALVFFGLLTVLQIGGSSWAWMSGSRKGHEQRKLWPQGVNLS